MLIGGGPRVDAAVIKHVLQTTEFTAEKIVVAVWMTVGLVFLGVPFLVLQVHVLKVTRDQLSAVLRHVLLIRMLQKMLDVAIKLLVLNELMEVLVVHLLVLEVQKYLEVTRDQLSAVLRHVLLIRMLQKMLDVACKLLVLNELMEILVVVH